MNNATLRRRFHCVYQLDYHLVLVTKYRKKCLNDAMLKRIEESALERYLSRDGELVTFNGESEHVHLLISVPPHIALSEYVNALKTNTARMLRRDFEKELSSFYKEPVLWSRSYGVFSSGGASLDVLKNYIKSQDRPL